MRSHYDYLIVGAGITSAVFAHEASKVGKSCLVIDRRSHVAGNIYTEEVEGINVHKYGAHIFHTSLRPVWEYVNRFAEFNNYVNSPVAVYKDELYNMPFNMNTFSKMWGVRTPTEARAIIEEQKAACAVDEPKNLEEQALSLVGRDVYEKLVKGYTEKQWGRDCTELPASIIKRLPVRFIYDNNYFNDRWQGIPIGGYTAMVERMLGDTEVLLDTEYRDFIAEHPGIADRVIYCGPIDEYFDYRLGALEYRSLRFESERVECDNWQGNAVVNYTEREVPYTRIIEHKHFELLCQGAKAGTVPKTVITREYPAAKGESDEPYYPMNDEKNNALYARYKELADAQPNVIFGGRLGQYKYYDMHNVVAEALAAARAELG